MMKRKARMNKFGIVILLTMAFFLGNCEKDKPAAGDAQDINKENAQQEADKLIKEIKGL